MVTGSDHKSLHSKPKKTSHAEIILPAIILLSLVYIMIHSTGINKAITISATAGFLVFLIDMYLKDIVDII